MKKVPFYAFWLLALALSACNNNDKGKENKTDSVKIAAFTNPGALDGQTTINHKDYYSQLDSTTKRVSFVYADFMNAIKTLDSIYGNAKEIYLFYGAYTPGDVTRYLDNHPTMNRKKDSLKVLNQPCLLFAYQNPNVPDQFTYKDFGTICPPPTSCETHTLIHNPKTFFLPGNLLGFNPQATIDNYQTLYNTDQTNNPLTDKVHFNIDSIRNLVSATADVNKDTIYFFMGAYDNNDAVRYSKSHTNNVSSSTIQNKTCLLFALQTNASAFKYYDFGCICPPANSCVSTFK